MRKHEYLYFIMIFSLHLLYALLFVGFEIYEASEYIDTLNLYLRLYVCAFLIFRFNPFRKIDTFSDFDRQVVFTSALLILTSVGVTKIYQLVKGVSVKYEEIIQPKL